MKIDIKKAVERLKGEGVCYCEFCNKETRHFASMGLGLLVCEECFAVAGWIVFGEEPLDRSESGESRVLENVRVERRVGRR